MLKYVIAFFVSMIPVVELRGAVPIAIASGIDPKVALSICVLGNILPVPFIYLFARKVLTWGAKQKHIGKACTFFLVKGEHAGQRLVKATGRGGLFIALVLFVGIPIPGTGAWTGTLGASFLDMGVKSTVLAVGLGVLLAGVIMAVASTGVLSIL